MRDLYVITTLGRMYFLAIKGALTEVKFISAEISLLNGEAKYGVLLPDGSTQEITSSKESPLKIYNSAKEYENKRHTVDSHYSLESIAHKLNVQVELKKSDGEPSFEFFVWTFEDGFAKRVVFKSDVIYIDEHNKYTSSFEVPKQHYPSEAIVNKLHRTKVIDADGTQSYVGGKLATLFLSPEQRELLKEWEAVSQRLKDADIMIVHSENTGKTLAVNAPDVECIYASYDIGDDTCDNAIEISVSYLHEFYTTNRPPMYCEDRENDSIIVVLKHKPEAND